jgi:hypothetical protein
MWRAIDAYKVEDAEQPNGGRTLQGTASAAVPYFLMSSIIEGRDGVRGGTGASKRGPG